MSPQVSVSFSVDIRPLFRDKDIASMQRARGFDLSRYDDVSVRAPEILKRLAAGDMPCDGAWPTEDVELFRRWIREGKNP
jgi:hypothetical protein